MTRGFLVSPYSAQSERMAYALVKSIRRYNAAVPVHVMAQGYMCGLDWRGMAIVKSVRAAQPHRSVYQWFNKLSALERSPFDETIFLDCDIVLLRDPSDWFGILGTDDFTYFRTDVVADEVPDELFPNNPNPHRMREEFGVNATPIIDGGGHFFFRRSARAEWLLEEVVQVMCDAMEQGSGSLYHRIAGPGNTPCADELAACIVFVREGVTLPLPIPAPQKKLAIYLPPYQTEGIFDLREGLAQFHCKWASGIVRPEAVHFCYTGKRCSAYQEYVEMCIRGRRTTGPTVTAVCAGTEESCG